MVHRVKGLPDVNKQNTNFEIFIEGPLPSVSKMKKETFFRMNLAKAPLIVTKYGAVSMPKIKVELDDAMVNLFNKLLCL